MWGKLEIERNRVFPVSFVASGLRWKGPRVERPNCSKFATSLTNNRIVGISKRLKFSDVALDSMRLIDIAHLEQIVSVGLPLVAVAQDHLNYPSGPVGQPGVSGKFVGDLGKASIVDYFEYSLIGTHWDK